MSLEDILNQRGAQEDQFFQYIPQPTIHVFQIPNGVILHAPLTGRAVQIRQPQLGYIERFFQWIEHTFFGWLIPSRPSVRGVFGNNYYDDSQEGDEHKIVVWLNDPIRSTIAIDVGNIHADEYAIGAAIDSPESCPDLAAQIARVESGNINSRDDEIALIGVRLVRLKRGVESLVARAIAGYPDAKTALQDILQVQGIVGNMARDYVRLAALEPLQYEAMQRPVHFDQSKYPLA